MAGSRRRGAHWWASAVALVGALFATGCSSSSADGPAAGAGGTDVTAEATVAAADDAADVEALDLEGKVDRVIVMIPPNGEAKPPDSGLFGGGAVLGGRHVLRAPMGDGSTVDLWVMRVRSPQMGPGIVECRVTVSSDGSGSGSTCGPLDAAGAPLGQPQSLVLGSMRDESSFTLDLVGPADMTHFIVTVGDQRFGVIPIEGQALLHVEGDCPPGIRVAAWRGAEQLREEPANWC